MAKSKADPRKEVGADVHVKCTNVLSTHSECSRIYGSKFKAVFCDGEVKDVRIRSTDAGRNCTKLYVEFKIAGVMEVKRWLSLAKVYAGKAPGPRPPSPDVEIVTPARVTTFNRDDLSRGPAQSNVHRTPKNVKDFFGTSVPGFTGMQRQRMGKKQRTGSNPKREGKKGKFQSKPIRFSCRHPTNYAFLF